MFTIIQVRTLEVQSFLAAVDQKDTAEKSNGSAI
jgi:hypothetical protein